MNTTKHAISSDGIDLTFCDVSTSETMRHMKEQVFDMDEYGLRTMNFVPGDIIVDIGANVGCVSIYLAKKYPFLKIYAYEAHPTNYDNLVANIALNNVTNIVPHNLAVFSRDNEEVRITLNPNNTGSSSLLKINPNGKDTASVRTISLDTIIETYGISRIKFLKLDCEGSEFDILPNSSGIHKIIIEMYPLKYIHLQIKT